MYCLKFINDTGRQSVLPNVVILTDGDVNVLCLCQLIEVTPQGFLIKVLYKAIPYRFAVCVSPFLSSGGKHLKQQ